MTRNELFAEALKIIELYLDNNVSVNQYENTLQKTEPIIRDLALGCVVAISEAYNINLIKKMFK